MSDETKFVNEMDYVLDHFNFEKCHKVMEFLDWKWAQSNGCVPSIGEMRQFARELIRDAYRNMTQQETITKECTIECGGFVVRVEQEYPGQKVYIRLRFSAASWDNYD
jgi:hypothetical protein